MFFITTLKSFVSHGWGVACIGVSSIISTRLVGYSSFDGAMLQFERLRFNSCSHQIKSLNFLGVIILFDRMIGICFEPIGTRSLVDKRKEWLIYSLFSSLHELFGSIFFFLWLYIETGRIEMGRKLLFGCGFGLENILLLTNVVLDSFSFEVCLCSLKSNLSFSFLSFYLYDILMLEYRNDAYFSFHLFTFIMILVHQI